MSIINQAIVVDKFKCLGSDCPDTCCYGWKIQIDSKTNLLYKQTAELDNIIDNATIVPTLKKDPSSNYCTKLENGLCGVQNKYGEDYLSDACYFYPRIVRKFDTQVVVTASLSCPAVTSLMLEEDFSYELIKTSINRLPQEIKNYLPSNLNGSDALKIHKFFLKFATQENYNADQIMFGIYSMSKTLNFTSNKNWYEVIKLFDLKSLCNESIYDNDLTDLSLVKLINSLVINASATKLNYPRLKQVLGYIESAFNINIDWQDLSILMNNSKEQRYNFIRKTIAPDTCKQIDLILKKYIQAQISINLYPFYDSLAQNIFKRTSIIALKYATIKFALYCKAHLIEGNIADNIVVMIIQSISKIYDHVENYDLLWNCFEDSGLLEESVLASMIMDMDLTPHHSYNQL
jgi:hypothetical protein